jgi:two-component system KDP operon response regulator KdpE
MDNLRGASCVLVADSDARSVRFITHCLSDSGLRVLHARDAPGAVDAESTESPCAVLIDDHLPASLDAVAAIRDASTVPIAFTALGQDESAALALRAGADVLLVKPFSGELLLAQVFALMRRYRTEQSQFADQVYESDGLMVDLERRTVSLSGIHLHLSTREYRLLEILAVNCGRILTHDQLLSLVWGPGYEGNSDLLRCYIRKVRKRIGADGRNPHLIQTENSVGYWMDRSHAK